MRTYRRLLGFLRPYRLSLWGSLVFAWAAMGMTVLIPWLVGQAVDAIQDGRKPDLLPVVLAILAAAVLRLGLTVVRRLIAGRVSLSVEVDIRERLYRHLQTLELGFFDGQQTGQLMSRATSDLQSIRFFLGYGLIFITQAALTIALALAVMLVINPGLALLAIVPLPAAVYVGSRFQRLSRPAQREVQQRVAELTAQAEEGVSGINVIKAFAREEHQIRRFSKAVERLFRQSIYTTKLQAAFQPLLGFIPQIGTALVLLVGGRQVIAGNLSLGEFTAFYTYLLMLVGPVRTLGMALAMSQRAIAAGDRFFEVLDREPELTSPPDAPPLPDGPGQIDFENVTFRYRTVSEEALPSGEAALASLRADGEVGPAKTGPSSEARPVLDQVTISIPAGSTVALTGPSGSGKTTLAALIARLYDPDQGSVKIDGADLSEVDLGSLRRSVAHAGGDSFLFSATVAENIAYARPEAGYDEIVAAARRAQAHGFIEELPDGYETMVGERGLTVSGGQRQRIAIARALIADPRILILDDATASVDASTEAALRQAIREVMSGRTTIIIAHRQSTLALADEIVVLDHGRIIDRGEHHELAERSDFYSQIALPAPAAEPATSLVEARS